VLVLSFLAFRRSYNSLHVSRSLLPTYNKSVRVMGSVMVTSAHMTSKLLYWHCLDYFSYRVVFELFLSRGDKNVCCN
jgi:hypothetical protein